MNEPNIIGLIVQLNDDLWMACYVHNVKNKIVFIDFFIILVCFIAVN